MGKTVSIYLPARLLVRLNSEENKSEAVQDALNLYYAQNDADNDRLARIEEKLDKVLAGGIVTQAQPTSEDAVDASAIDDALGGW